MRLAKLFGILLLLVNLQAQKIDMYTEHYPPYNMKQNGKLHGLSIEILDAMLKHMKSSQSIKDVKLTNWSRAYSIAQIKKNAMVFSTNLTDSRKRLFKWVGPIVSTKVGVIAPKNKNITIKNVKELNNYKIGAVLKDVGEVMLLENGIDPKQIQHVKGENAINLSFIKMKNNRIDMFAYDINVAFANARLQGFDVSNYEVVYILKEGALYFAFNVETDDSVIKKWQSALDAIKDNGTYQKIMMKY